MALDPASLAEQLGVAVETVQDWENDVAEPSANKLQTLSGILGVSLTWLLNAEGDGVEAPPEPGDLTKDGQALLRELRTLRDDMDRASTRLAKVEKRLHDLIETQDSAA